MVKRLIQYSVFLIALLIPCLGIIYLSLQEQNQYKVEQSLEFTNVAYGDIVQVERIDMKESIKVSGTGVSKSYLFQEIGKYEYPDRIRFIVSEGDYVTEGKIIGYYKNEAVLATQSGLIESIYMGSDSYIKYLDTSKILLKINTNNDYIVNILNKQNIELTDHDGNIYYVSDQEDTLDSEGNSSFYLTCEQSNIKYNQVYENLELFTGTVYSQTLAIQSDCVYTYPGDENNFYVRSVDEKGNFIQEIEVITGYECDGYIAVSNIEEGTYCDKGYKKLIENGVLDHE